MGIHAELILPEFQNGPMAEVLLNLNCSICDELIENAVTLGCQHNFCRLCLTGWIASQTDESNVPCPGCRTIFDSTSGLEGSRLIRNVLSVVKFKCTNQLCEEKVNYGELTLHQGMCLYGCVTCSFCEEEIVRKDLESHKIGCIGYVKYQKSELEIENTSLRAENSALNNEIGSLKTENSVLKTQIGNTQEPGLISNLLKLYSFIV